MCKQKHKKQRHNGGALISALFITAIAAIIATALAVQERLLIHEGELVVNADQSYLNLQGMQLLAKNAVGKYVYQWMNPKDVPAQLIPLEEKLPTLEMGQMKLSGTIDDEQGKFNINDLVYSANQPRFVALLKGVVQGISNQAAYAIAKAITAWMTNDSQNAYYLSLHPSYRASKTEMANISELRLVVGMTPDIYAALAPNITALPVMLLPKILPVTPVKTVPETVININSALAPVFLTANPALNVSQAEDLVACRKRFGGFTSIQTFITDCVQPSGIPALTDIGVTSNYFLVEAQALWNHHLVSMSSLLVTRVKKDNKLTVDVVWQDFQ